MSLGIGANAKKVLEDANTVIYEYGGYNLNEPEFGNENRVLDGIITIPKGCFVEPEIHEKLKKMPSGRKKLVIKRIPVSVDYRKMIEEGLITVENCSNCWHTIGERMNIDVMASRILYCAFHQYQVDGKIPEHISIHM